MRETLEKRSICKLLRPFKLRSQSSTLTFLHLNIYTSKLKEQLLNLDIQLISCTTRTTKPPIKIFKKLEAEVQKKGVVECGTLFWCLTVCKFLSGLHCVVIWIQPRLPLVHPNAVQRGPTQEAFSPTLRSIKPGDTAVKLNLQASLSPGCQGRTSGMSPGQQWMISVLISPYADICEDSNDVWEFFTPSSAWIP